MKKWNVAEIVELNIDQTAQELWGESYDGGYIGDGHIGILGPKEEKTDDETGKLS